MEVLLFGLAQGLTEFLPVSSSGHLYLLKRLFAGTGAALPFFVFLHIATLSAVVIFFRAEIAQVLTNKKILVQLSFITFITGICALLIRHFFINLFVLPLFISFCFILNGLILLAMRNKRQMRKIDDLRFGDLIAVGVVQGLAVFPGISRSGITISTLLGRGFSADESFVLSFIMSLPVIVSAFFLEFNDLAASGFSLSQFFLGFISAFFFGMVALKIVKRSLRLGKFSYFGYYCLALGLGSLIL